MEKKKNDGGPAFPSETISYYMQEGGIGKPTGHPQPVWKTMGGLTVRQYYAAHALQGLLARSPLSVLDNKSVASSYSIAALIFADAMIAAEKDGE